MTQPTPFGRVVLELMRERGLADASELGLERLDLQELRRHFDGEVVRKKRRHTPREVAAALGATEVEKVKMAVAYMGWKPRHANA